MRTSFSTSTVFLRLPTLPLTETVSILVVGVPPDVEQKGKFKVEIRLLNIGKLISAFVQIRFPQRENENVYIGRNEIVSRIIGKSMK